MNDGWEFQLIHRPDFMGYGLYLSRKLSDGSREFKTENGLMRIAPREASNEQLHLAIIDDITVLKSLVDKAENVGIRPDSAAKLEGELNATRLHLADMRDLVFERSKK